MSLPPQQRGPSQWADFLPVDAHSVKPEFSQLDQVEEWRQFEADLVCMNQRRPAFLGSRLVGVAGECQVHACWFGNTTQGFDKAFQIDAPQNVVQATIEHEWKRRTEIR